MAWTVLRRDFVDGKVECRLGVKRHFIRTGTAYVIENEHGEIAFCGPTWGFAPISAKSPKLALSPLVTRDSEE